MALHGIIQSGRTQVQAGKYRHRVTILQPSLSQDSTGGWDVRNNTLIASSYPASIEALSAMEKFAAHEFSSAVTHKIIVPHPRSAIPQGIRANMQILWLDYVGNPHLYQVEGVLNPDGRPDALVLMVIEMDDSSNEAQVTT